MINFEYRWGRLDAGDPATDTEWAWERGDLEIVISRGGQLAGTIPAPEGATQIAKRNSQAKKTIPAPEGATVVQVKALIRDDAKQSKRTRS